MTTRLSPHDTARWTELRHAYGPAEDVPRLLDALSTTPLEEDRAEIWFALWRMLCRPDMVFTAAYAAVPHLVRIAAAAGITERAGAVHLVCRIEMRRRAEGSPAVPDDLLVGYAGAIERLPDIVAGSIEDPWDRSVAAIFAAALLIGKRCGPLAEPLLATLDA